MKRWGQVAMPRGDGSRVGVVRAVTLAWTRVWAIAVNTFREAIRNKVLYGIAFFAIGMIFFSVVLGTLSVHEEKKLITDIGFSAVSFFGVIMAIFIGVNLVYKEIDRKTIYAIIPKPIERYQFMVGKFLGVVMTLFAQTVLLSIFLFLFLALYGAPLTGTTFAAIYLIFLAIIVMTAVALFFSSFSTPYLSGFFSLGIFILGSVRAEAIAQISKVAKIGTLYDGLQVFASVIPDLTLFNVVGRVQRGDHVPFLYLVEATGYAVTYAAVLLALGSFAFNRRDFV
ncbi:MAG: ABC transporter permease subunit [Deltaproteobacteria bacterium]|nr:ABC transporter permease subunit [Deltaproteobacteria bacterium]